MAGEKGATIRDLISKNYPLFYQLSLILVAITLPTKWVQINSIAILTVVGLWLLGKDLPGRFRELVKDPKVIMLGSVLLAYIVSVFYSEDRNGAWKSIESRFALLAFPMVMGSFYTIKRSWLDRILAGFVISSVAIALLCQITNFIKNYKQGIFYSANTGWLFSADPLVEDWGFHPSYFAIYSAFCIFIIAWWAVRKKLSYFIAVPVILYLVFFMMMLASRVGILALVILAGLSILYIAYINGKLLIGILSTIALFILIGISLFSFDIMREKINAMLNRNVHQYNQDFKVTVRMEQWRASMEIIGEHPISGVGIGDRKTELVKKYQKNGFQFGVDSSFDSHNLFLDTAVCTGIVGVILLLIQLWISFAAAIKSRHPMYLLFLLLYTMFSFVEAVYSVQKGVVFFAFFNTLFYVYVKSEEKAPSVVNE